MSTGGLGSTPGSVRERARPVRVEYPLSFPLEFCGKSNQWLFEEKTKEPDRRTLGCNFPLEFISPPSWAYVKGALGMARLAEGVGVFLPVPIMLLTDRNDKAGSGDCVVESVSTCCACTLDIGDFKADFSTNLDFCFGVEVSIGVEKGFPTGLATENEACAVFTGGVDGGRKACFADAVVETDPE